MTVVMLTPELLGEEFSQWHQPQQSGRPAQARLRHHHPQRRRLRTDVWTWQWWDQGQLTDAIAVTPAIFYLNNPGGEEGGRDQICALVKTGFRF